MKSRFSVFCAAISLLGMLASTALCFYFAWQAGITESVQLLVAFVLSLIIAPTVHELGHIALAKKGNMELVYTKFFCFQIKIKEGKKRLGLTSPFRTDETQVIPKTGGNMQRRAAKYTLGGLLLSGILLALLCAAAITLTCLGNTNFLLWGFVPYTAYLFLLNVLPLEYPSGKTDMLVYRGLKKGYDAEKNMLAAMEIQGQLYEGKSFSEVDERLYFNQPQLPEDEPLFAVMLDLKYRYYLEKQDLDKAADCLNRLAAAQAYLPQEKVEELAAELVYMHALRGDLQRAEDCGTYCKGYLQSNTASAKRILAAFSAAFGKTESVVPLIAQAETCLQTERVKGVGKFERILLSRLPQA